MKLKKKDKKLLYEFCRNSRLPYSVLGKKAGISQQLVSYKMRSFMENQLVWFTFPLIDYSRFKYLHFRVYFQINFKSRERFQKLVKSISRNKNVVEIMESGGRYDLIVSFLATNPSSFNKVLKKLITDNSEQLKNHMILTTVVSHFFPKKYLVGARNNKEDIIIGGDREPAGVDMTGMKILKELLRDPRSPAVDIAIKIKANPRTVISRMKILAETGVLKGFSSVIQLEKIGYKSSKMLIKYHNLSVRREDQLRAFCVSNMHITEMNKMFGEYDVGITVEAERSEEIRNVLIQIREAFEDIIMNSDSFPVFRIYKKRFFPGILSNKRI